MEQALNNLLSPAILCFFLGMAARLARSDLEFPQPLPKLFSLYLLFAIGIKGGIGLRESSIDGAILLTLGACILFSLLIPTWTYFLLRKRFGSANAAAIAATYGSISAVTFITATAHLDRTGIAYDSYMVAAMALMESPAIIIGVLLARRNESDGPGLNWKEVFRDAFLNGSVVVLVGAMLIGCLSAPGALDAVRPFTHDLFYGMLCLFLLDMGIVAARRITSIRSVGLPLLGFALLAPIVHALIALPLVSLLNLSDGNALLFLVLVASASYIAVPAAMRLAVPQSQASLYLPMSLALTFPFNILAGIPIYQGLIRLLPA